MAQPDDAVMSHLIDELANMPTGSRLDSERVLADRLGVSRTALRDRIGRLESMGVLERRLGSGTYVGDLSAATVSESLHFAMLARGLDLDSILPVRWSLEREAARRAAKNSNRSAGREMEAALEDMELGTSTERMHAADRAFHSALLRASGSAGLQFFWEIMWSVLKDSIIEVVAATEKARMQEVHGAIYLAVQDGDPIRAVYAVDRHFEWAYTGETSGPTRSLAARADAAEVTGRYSVDPLEQALSASPVRVRPAKPLSPRRP